MPIVDDPFDFGAIAATNAISDVYAMGGTPLFALALVGMPVNQLPVDMIRRDPRRRRGGLRARRHPDRRRPHDRLGRADLRPGRDRPRRSAANLKRNAGARPGDQLVLGKPIGVGVYSAALKKEKLVGGRLRGDDREHDASSTRPGIALGKLDGVHALTDVTGFGLLGHLLEICRGSNAGARIDFAAMPLHPGALELARAGHLHRRVGPQLGGLRQRRVDLGAAIGDAERALLTDPQTSGGLLVACAPAAVDDVLAIFRDEGFERAADRRDRRGRSAGIRAVAAWHVGWDGPVPVRPGSERRRRCPCAVVAKAIGWLGYGSPPSGRSNVPDFEQGLRDGHVDQKNVLIEYSSRKAIRRSSRALLRSSRASRST